MEVLEGNVYRYRNGNNEPDLNLEHTKIVDVGGKRAMVFGDIGDRRDNYLPARLVKCYKVMRKYADGSFHPLFAGIGKGFKSGDVMEADGYSSPNDRGSGTGKHITPRYALHGGVFIPAAPQIMKADDIEHSLHGSFQGQGLDGEGHRKFNGGEIPSYAVVEVFMDITHDYTDVIHELAKKKRTYNRTHPKSEAVDDDNGVLGMMPFGGAYVFQESNLSMWVCSSMGIIGKEISEEDRQNILRSQGYDEQMVFQTGKLPALQKTAISNALRLKQIDRAINIQKMYLKNLEECKKKGWNVPDDIFLSRKERGTDDFFFTDYNDYRTTLALITDERNRRRIQREKDMCRKFNEDNGTSISYSDWSYYSFMNDLNDGWKKVKESQAEVSRHIVSGKSLMAYLYVNKLR